MTFAPRPVHLAGSILLATMLTACGGGGGGGGAGIIDPGDSDSVADALRVKFGGSDATVVEGDPPRQNTETAGNPALDVPDEQDRRVTPGQTKEISYDADTEGASALSVLYAKVTGSGSFFRAELSQAQAYSKQSGGLPSLSLEIPGNLGAGEFCVQVSIQDDAQRISNVDEICFESVPADGSAAAALESLQGNWERCFDGRIEMLAIDGDILDFSEAEYANQNCTGDVLATFSDTLQITVGPELISDSGLTVNEIDLEVIDSPNESEIGNREFSIFRVDDDTDQLFTSPDDASSPENRPTALDLDNPYTRAAGGGNAQLTGSWRLDTGDPDSLALINFLPDGTYVLASVSQQDSVDQRGMEWASYTRDTESGLLDISIIFDSTGAAGLFDTTEGDQQVEDIFVNLSGERLVIEFFEDGQADERLEFDPIASNGILGTWLVRQPNENDLLLFNFLDDGSYIHFEVDDDDPEETSGLEWGDYTHDPASGVLTVSGRFDENGSTGLSDAYDPPPNLLLSANGGVLTLEVDEDGDQQIEDSVSFERQ